MFKISVLGCRSACVLGLRAQSSLRFWGGTEESRGVAAARARFGPACALRGMRRSRSKSGVAASVVWFCAIQERSEICGALRDSRYATSVLWCAAKLGIEGCVLACAPLWPLRVSVTFVHD